MRIITPDPLPRVTPDSGWPRQLVVGVPQAQEGSKIGTPVVARMRLVVAGANSLEEVRLRSVCGNVTSCYASYCFATPTTSCRCHPRKAYACWHCQRVAGS